MGLILMIAAPKKLVLDPRMLLLVFQQALLVMLMMIHPHLVQAWMTAPYSLEMMLLQ